MKYMLYTSIIFLSACTGTKKNESTVTEVTIDSAAIRQEKFSQFLISYESMFKTHFNAYGSPGAAMVIVMDTQVVLMKGYGFKQVEEENPVDEFSVFRLASLSKGFTGLLTGVLVEKGVLNWNDKVVDYLPNFKLSDTAQTRRIEIRHLLSHTTGLPRHAFATEIEKKMELDEIMQKMDKKKLEGPEGITYGYQNSAFSLIDLILQSKTGKSWRQWMKEEILDKANMKHASLTYEEIIADTNIALPHDRNKREDFYSTKIHERYYNVAPAAAVNASISDMANYLQILIGNRPDIISDTMLNRVFTPFVELPHDEYYDRWDGVTNSWYAMGWRVLTYHGRTIVHHGGYVNYYRSEIAVDRENKIGICVLFNAQNGCARTVIPTFLNYYDFYSLFQ